jgi:hypothetical protein
VEVGVGVRRATAADAAVLASLGCATYRATFAHTYPAEDMPAFEAYLAETFSHDAALQDVDAGAWCAVLPLLTFCDAL